MDIDLTSSDHIKQLNELDRVNQVQEKTLICADTIARM